MVTYNNSLMHSHRTAFVESLYNGSALRYGGEAWYVMKRTAYKVYYRNRPSSKQLTVNLRTGIFRVKRLIPNILRYGNVFNAWCVDVPKRKV